MQSISSRLVRLAHELNIEHQELAQIGGVSKATFSGYVAGSRLPRADTIANWVRGVNLNANWLLTGDGEILLTGSRAELASDPDPVVRRLQTVEAMMLRHGASPEEVRDALRMALRTLSAAGADDEVSEKPEAAVS